MKRLSSGVSQIGGKFRLLNMILSQIPYHEFYLEPFLGSAIVLLNKPRCRYECGNDLNAELINYLLVTSGKYDEDHPRQFDELKQGVYGLVSQDICNQIVRGELIPRNRVERAYFYYYLNKLTFGGGIWMVRKDPPYKFVSDDCNFGNRKHEVKNAKEQYQEKVYETKGFAGMNQNRAIPQTTLHQKDFDEIKEDYEWKTKGYIGLIDQKQQNARIDSKGVEEAKAKYSGLINSAIKADPMNQESIEKTKASFRGLAANSNQFHNASKRDVEKTKKRVKNAQNKGINPKTTRPFTNNDCGLLTPLQLEAIKRLRYVNLTCYPFQKVYKMFYNAFHKRKGLGPEAFVYWDPPYPKMEKYYKSGFGMKDHLELIDLLIESPFHCLLSIGVGEDCKFYIDALKEAGWIIQDAWTRHSTDANTQDLVQEFLCMNYDINKLPKMIVKVGNKEVNTNNKRMDKWL